MCINTRSLNAFHKASSVCILSHNHLRAPWPPADVERIADPTSALPHMLPSEAQFAAAADALGVAPDDALVSWAARRAPRTCGP